MRAKKYKSLFRKKIFLTVFLMLAISLSLFIIKDKETIPEELEEALISDAVLSFSFLYSPFLRASFMDHIIGFQSYRYTISKTEEYNWGSRTLHCLKMKVVYRVPGKASVYDLGSPVEFFLYEAWEENTHWHVRQLEKSGVGNKLSTLSCYAHTNTR